MARSRYEIDYQGDIERDLAEEKDFRGPYRRDFGGQTDKQKRADAIMAMYTGNTYKAGGGVLANFSSAVRSDWPSNKCCG